MRAGGILCDFVLKSDFYSRADSAIPLGAWNIRGMHTRHLLEIFSLSSKNAKCWAVLEPGLSPCAYSLEDHNILKSLAMEIELKW